MNQFSFLIKCNNKRKSRAITLHARSHSQAAVADGFVAEDIVDSSAHQTVAEARAEGVLSIVHTDSEEVGRVDIVRVDILAAEE